MSTEAGAVLLCIHGSPRARGNTDILLDAVAAGADQGGIAVEHLFCRDLEVQACTGCGVCSSTGECVLADGMDDVYQMVDRAAAVVVGAPVYFLGLPSECKRLIDRFQPRWARRYLLDLPPPSPARPGAVVATAGAPSHSVFTGGQRTVEALFEVLGVTCRANLFYEGIDERGAIRQHPTALRDARELGERLAQEIRRQRP